MAGKSAKQIRADVASELDTVVALLEESRELLQKQKGIGGEMYIKALDKMIQKYQSTKKKVNSIKC